MNKRFCTGSFGKESPNVYANNVADF